MFRKSRKPTDNSQPNSSMQKWVDVVLLGPVVPAIMDPTIQYCGSPAAVGDSWGGGPCYSGNLTRLGPKPIKMLIRKTELENMYFNKFFKDRSLAIKALNASKLIKSQVIIMSDNWSNYDKHMNPCP